MDSSPNHYFQYYPDGKLALHLESANPYTNQPGEDGYYALNWHKYSYEGSNLIIDSTFIYASGPVNGDFRPNSHYAEGSSIKVTWLHLDSNGRIIKSEHYADQPNSSIEIHHYDNNGNLVLPGATYNTSKYKFRQTHKTWMLISRNYSVHSSSTEASTYNNKNLPAKMKIMPSYFFVEAPDETYSNITFHYECR